MANNFKENENVVITPDSNNYYKYAVLYNVWGGKRNDSTNRKVVRIDSVITDYKELLRDGLFGDYHLVRELKLIYSTEDNSAKRDSIAITDTLLFENRSNIENSAFPFTLGKIPAEPFWESLLEPIIYIGVTISVIYLLFITRS